MNGRTATVAALALLALGGCFGVQVEDEPPPRYNYFTGDYEYATHKGAILAEIVGNPFDIPDGVFRDLVLARMQGSTRSGTPSRFVAVPTDETIAPFKVVAAFNMPQYVDGRTLCQGPAALPPARKGSGLVSLGMAFCFGDGLKSDTRGQVLDVKGVDDPQFTRLIKRVAEAMLPPHDAKQDDSDFRN